MVQKQRSVADPDRHERIMDEPNRGPVWSSSLFRIKELVSRGPQ